MIPPNKGRSGRSYMSDVVKAAAHPTRRAILKVLEQEASATTVELEEKTGENRYHLYHHLDVLERAGLISSTLVGKAKEFELLQAEEPEAVYLQLDRSDPGEREKLEALLEAVREIMDAQIPSLEKVVRARLMLSYPWSPEETE